MIEVKNLSKHFGPIKAIDDISFEVSRGEILGFLGPNGAGKTTTMRILTGFFPPTAGEVKIDGVDFFSHLFVLKKRIGYVAENAPLYDNMITQEFLQFVAQVKGLKGNERRRAVEKVAELCSVTLVMKRLIGKLSKGFRQRIALAQALIGSPDILIFDEPTIGLDPKQIIEIRQLIRNLKGKKTIILSTHILPEVSMVADRVIIIDKGRLVATGSPEELSTELKPTREILVKVVGDEKILQSLFRTIEGVLSVELVNRYGESDEYLISFSNERDIRPEVTKAIIDSNFKLLELKTTSLSLEDIFLKLVTKEEAS